MATAVIMCKSCWLQGASGTVWPFSYSIVVYSRFQGLNFGGAIVNIVFKTSRDHLQI